MKRIYALMIKEFRQVLRDKAQVILVFAVPLFQLIVLSFAFTTDVKHIRLAVVDLDGSLESRTLARAFGRTEQFDVVSFHTDLTRIREDMEDWSAQVALVIPHGFGKDHGRGRTPSLQAVVDGVDGNSAGVALGYARGILASLGVEADLPAAAGIRVEDRTWYNPNLSSRQYMVPGIVVVLLTMLPMMMSAMSLVKESEIGTLEQLQVTPMRKHELLLGKLAPFLALTYVELAVVMAAAVIVFDIPVNGSPLLYAGLAFLYLLTTLGCGIFVSTITHTQQQAMFTAWFVMVFMILMSGFFIPVENMPPFMQGLTYLNPMRYFMFITRDVFQKGSSLSHLVGEAGALAAFGILTLAGSVAKFRKVAA